jgi:hypothetical protein
MARAPPLRRVASVPESGVMRWQRFKHRARRTQIRCLEALRESAVHGREKLSRIVLPILPNPQAGKAESNPQFPRQGIMLPGHLERLGEAAFGRRDGLIACSTEQ